VVNEARDLRRNSTVQSNWQFY